MTTMTGSFDLSLLLHAASADTGRFVTGDLRWVQAEPADMMRLTASDRELIEVVTGERFERHPDSPVLASFFAWQLMCDRALGALQCEVTIPYVEALFTVYETCIDGSPMSGDLFDLALAYLVGRDLRVDPDVIWA